MPPVREVRHVNLLTHATTVIPLIRGKITKAVRDQRREGFVIAWESSE